MTSIKALAALICGHCAAGWDIFEAQLGAGRIVQAATGGFVQRTVTPSHVFRMPDRG
jgi:hypothetical protein